MTMAWSQGSGVRKRVRQKKAKKERVRQKKAKKEPQRPLFEWQDSAKQFEKKLKEFGYIGDDDGVCHGVACVAAHAMLLNEVDQFDHDLLRIRESSPSAYQNQFEERAFLEAVELCHHPRKYAHLFAIHSRQPNVIVPQYALNSIPLVESTDISAQGGVVAITKFSGVYDRSELIQCLKIIRTGIEKFSCPSALLLSDDCHIIALQYNPEESAWIFIDVRRLPSQRFDSEEALARAIASTLTPNLKKTVMSALVLATQQNESVAKKAFTHAMRMRPWKKIQGIDETKMQYLKRWLFVAAYDGCEKEVAFLLAHQVNPNRPIVRGDTPLTIAAHQGNEGVVKLLLKHGATVNERSKYVKSPLFNALSSGNDNIATLLRASGARLKNGEREELGLNA